MRIKVNASSPEVQINGLGILATNVWVDLTDEQLASFELHHGYPLSKSGFEVSEGTKPAVVAPATPKATVPVEVKDKNPDGGDE